MPVAVAGSPPAERTNPAQFLKQRAASGSETERERSDQVFIQAVFLLVHDLQQALLQLGFLGGDLREEITRPITASNVTFEGAGESSRLPQTDLLPDAARA